MSQEPGSKPPTPQGTSPHLRDILSRLRARIRGYVIIEGLAVVVIWVTALFLVALAIDYLPVLVGLTELPKPLRVLFLGILVIGAIYWFGRLIVNRLRVRLTDRNLALLIERYHDQFEESLVTTVELEGQSNDGVTAELYNQARQAAESSMGQVELGRVFNRRRLMTRLGLAFVLGIVFVGIAIWKPAAISLGVERLLLLQDKPWPRQSQIEVIGLRVVQELPNPVLQDQSSLIEFDGRQVKAAKGANLVLVVKAKGPTAERPKLKIPNRCVIYYRGQDGERGYQYMARVGSIADGTQLFEFDGQPFRGLTGDLSFDVRGDDHRLNGFEIDVVSSPAVVSAQAECRFPPYMVDEESGAWTPRSLDLESGLRLPLGSEMTLALKANKPLQRAWVYDPLTKETQTVDDLAGKEEFRIPVKSLADNLLLEVTLEDVDGVTSEVPYRAEILAFADEAPKIQTRLVGIGDAITPEARVPLQGTIEDDFGVAQAWIDVELPDAEPRSEPIAMGRGSDLDAAIDFRDKRQDRENGFQLSPDEGNKLRLSISAEDRFNLGNEPNVGRGDSFELEIVSPSQLLRRLERREASQRRLLEQIYLELTDAHNLLVRVRGQTADGSDFGEPGDSGVEPGDEGNLADLADAEVKLVFAQRSWLQLQKSRQEIQAISATFDNIRLQLINNRVESEDRKQRIQEKIIEPLNVLLDQRFPVADEKILAVQRTLEERLKTTGSTADEALVNLTNDAIEEMQLLLVDLDNVLQEMLKFESYNELLEVVRELIKTQEALIDETAKERKRQAFEDILK